MTRRGLEILRTIDGLMSRATESSRLRRIGGSTSRVVEGSPMKIAIMPWEAF